MASIYDALLNDPDDAQQSAAMVRALRRQHDLGTLGQLMGTAPTAQAGQQLQQDAQMSFREAMNARQQARRDRSGAAAPANWREWQLYNQLPESEQERYRAMKRGEKGLTIEDLAGGKVIFNPNKGTTTPLSSPRDEITAAADAEEAKTRARENAQNAVAAENTAKNNQRAFETFDTGMRNLRGAVLQYHGNPLRGSLPAWSRERQIFDGAVAGMGPIMKEATRQKGEGNWTDADNEVMMRILPTADDYPEVATAKMDAAEDYLRSKLGMPKRQTQPRAPQTPQQPRPQTSQQPSSGLRPGTVEDGYQFIGGDPSNPQSWRKVQP